MGDITSSDIVFRLSLSREFLHLHEKFACFIKFPSLVSLSLSTFESSFGNGSISFHDVCGWKFILWDKFGKGSTREKKNGIIKTRARGEAEHREFDYKNVTSICQIAEFNNCFLWPFF